MPKTYTVPAFGFYGLPLAAGDRVDLSGSGLVAANGSARVLGVEETRIGPFPADVVVNISAGGSPVKYEVWNAPLAAAIAPRRQIVATRGQMPINTEGGGATNYTRFETQMNAVIGPRPVSSLRLLYASRYAVNKGETTTGLTDCTLEAAVYARAQTIPFTFNGAKNPAVSAGAPLLMSDPVGMPLDAGASIQLRSGATVAAGGKVAVGRYMGSQITAYGSTSGASQVYSTSAMTLPAGGAAMSYGLAPVALLGIPDQRHVAVLLWGDSITYGQGDTNDATYAHHGWAERGLIGAAPGGYNTPFVNLSRSGDVTEGYTPVINWSRYALFRYATHLVCGMGTNDISAGVSLATMQAQCLDVWQRARQAGLRVYHTTITPKTTGSWDSAANQTIVAGYGPGEQRGQFNAWLWTQLAAGVIDGILDVNAAVEDAASPGKWRTDQGVLTADGLHPNTAGHVLMSAVMSASAATWSA